jgi:hypothetical protein
MKNASCSTQTCRHCRFYTPEGRRGGHCQQLNVEVQGGWTACSLAIPPFESAWENLEGILSSRQRSLAAPVVTMATYASTIESTNKAHVFTMEAEPSVA